MKRYTIYFCDMVEVYDSGSDKTESTDGQFLLVDELFRILLNEDLTIKIMDYEFGDNSIEFECWLDFDAENDQDAKDKTEEVLEDNNFGWIDTYYVVEKTKDENDEGRKIHIVGFEDEA